MKNIKGKNGFNRYAVYVKNECIEYHCDSIKEVRSVVRNLKKDISPYLHLHIKIYQRIENGKEVWKKVNL